MTTFLLCCSCAKQAFIATKSHRFHEKGDHVVWIQVAGLASEHMAMLKFPLFNSDKGQKKISFEENVCTGSLWSYNLYDLRPDARKSFLSQILGSKNIKGSCEDLDRDPVWKYFQQVGYRTGIFESQKIGKGIDYFNDCSTKKSFLEDATIWLRKKAPQNATTFHYQGGLNHKATGILYDRSCDSRTCDVPFERHVLKVWKNFSDNHQKTFFVVRDFTYEKLLLGKKMIAAKERLKSLENIYDYFLKLSKRKKITLVLSSSSQIKLDFPRMGRSWSRFEKTGRGLGHSSRSLSSEVWAAGLGSENFCGVYEESDLLRRFIWAPDQNLINRLKL